MSIFRTPESVQHSIDADLTRLAQKPPVAPVMHDYTIDKATTDIQSLFTQAYPSETLPVIKVVDPPKGVEADLAVPAFALSKTLHSSPAAIAQTVAETARQRNDTAPPTLAVVNHIGPYVNVGLNRGEVFSRTVGEAIALDGKYGHSSSRNGEMHVIDYSSPNASKLLGFQHTRTTFVGEANARIAEANGAKVIRTNYVGDFGKPTGKILLAIEKYGFNPDVNDPMRALNELYVKISRETAENPEMNTAADTYAARLEEGDPDVVAMWERIRELSLQENTELYNELGIHFDTTVGESYFVAGAHEISQELLRRGIAIEDDGAVIVPSETIRGVTGLKNADVLMLLNSRGKTTYGSRDLAAIRYRLETYNATSIEYVVGAEQNGYLSAVFAVAGLAGIAKGARLHHTELGLLLNSAGKKMSSRDGSAMPLADQMANEYKRALASVRERGVIVDPKEQHELAKALGYGNLVYPIVSRDPSTNIALGDGISPLTEAGSSGYVQYSHARATGLLSGITADSETLRGARLDSAPTEAEWMLTKALMGYPSAVRSAGAESSPGPIGSAIESIANYFNTFYQLDSIKGAATPERQLARIALVRAAQITLRNGLDLLNVAAPSRM